MLVKKMLTVSAVWTSPLSSTVTAYHQQVAAQEIQSGQQQAFSVTSVMEN